MPTRKQTSDSPVAAREELDQRERENDGTDQLEEQASEQEKQQKEELGFKHSTPGAKAAAKLQDNAEKNAAAARAGHDSHVVQGFMDNMTKRSAEDALEGHFVSIDLNHDGVKEAYKAVGLEDHRGDYGVYMTRGSLDPETGVPEVVVVRLRDETNAFVSVPYEAVRPAEARGR